MKKVRWGVLSTAKIGVTKVIPAIQALQQANIIAIASRDKSRAAEVAQRLQIPRVYGTYEELLADPEVDAVFNPLPNSMHLEWSLKTLRAGKHLLCEKPLTLNAVEAQTLMHEASGHPELKVMEAFMYRFHPQWQFSKQQVREGRIGTLNTIQSFFSYYNADPSNIRNKMESGGGALLDIGCYCISLARFIFQNEPGRVFGSMFVDPDLKTDIHISGTLDFSGKLATFTCSTQSTPYQRVNIIGAKGRIEIEIPFNAPLDKPCRLWIHDEAGAEEKLFDVCNQYTAQGDAFCNAILNHTPVPTPLEDAMANMKTIDAFRKSAETGAWIVP